MEINAAAAALHAVVVAAAVYKVQKNHFICTLDFLHNKERQKGAIHVQPL
jgi:hypothetical protein